MAIRSQARRRDRVLAALFCVLILLGGGQTLLHGQPDPRLMAGIPRPVDDLPDGSVSVRVIRGSFANNIPNQPVQLQVGSETLTVNTDAEGRAQFDKLAPGAAIRASAVVDGERIESEPFTAPAQGGIRLVLLASAGADPSGGSAAAAAAAGNVAIGGQSRIILQPGDNTVTVYYLLEMVNPAPTPVNPSTPFTFEMPAGTTRTEVMQGSSVPATVSGRRVQVNGPFPPGTSQLNVGSEIPHASGVLEIAQLFPAPVNQFALIVQKIGGTTVSSPYVSQQREVTQQGEIYIAGAGTPVPEGQPLTLTVTNMPHHSAVPRRVAILLALAIVAAGVVAVMRPGAAASDRGAVDRRRLLARREKLLNELTRLERDRRRNHPESAPPDERLTARRNEIVAALEQVYGALDSGDVRPGAGTSAGAVA